MKATKVNIRDLFHFEILDVKQCNLQYLKLQKMGKSSSHGLSNIQKVTKLNNIDKLSSFDISQVGHVISHNCGILAMSNMELGIEVCGAPCGSCCA
jgi:hypothetical protein